MRADPKKHKRTPSFTTRRRTQSFRRHTKNLNTMENLPPVEVDGFLDRKQVRFSFCIFWEIYSKSTKDSMDHLLRHISQINKNKMDSAKQQQLQPQNDYIIPRSFNLEGREPQSVHGRATTRSSVDSLCASSGRLRRKS